MKKKKTENYIFVIILSLILLSTSFGFALRADNSKESKVTIDWNEFRSLLKLDVDEIKLSWDEFAKLMEQTGTTYKPEYRVEGGEVILTREEFKKIVDRMKPPPGVELKPPADYIIMRASYNGVMGSQSTNFTVFLDLEIFDRHQKSYLKIPLFGENLAISEVKIDGKPASIITEGGWHYLSTSEIGRHSVSIKFSLNSSPDNGSPGLNFSIPQTPITYLSLDIPKPDIEVNVGNAQEVKTVKTKDHTVVRSYLSPASYVSISWKKEEGKVVRGKARIYSEVFNLLSIEADAITVTTMVELNVMQNKINMLSLIVPENYQVINVSGDGVAGWSVREESGRQLLDVSFEYMFEGTKVFTIKSEKLLPEETIVANFEGFEVLGAIRESGYVAGEVKSDAGAEVQEFNNLERIDFQKIPYQLSNLSVRPILFAFKYVKHPFDMVVRITKYKKEEALTSFIDLAKGVTLLTEDGKLVHQITFTMQNLWDQFLKVSLPQDVSIWSVYVNGKRERASKDDNGKVLIPLVRSERGFDGSLTPFDVELIYTEKMGGFSLLGKKKHSFPTTDILINKAEWSLYLPVNYNYIKFSGNLKPTIEEIVPVVMPPSEPTKTEGFEEEASMDEEMRGISGAKEIIAPSVSQAVLDKSAQVFATGEAGLLSVRVNIPVSGIKYSFEKKIVEREETLFLGFTYINEIIIKALVLLLVLILIYVFIRKRRVFIPMFEALWKQLINLSKCFRLALSPGGFLAIITVVLIICFFLRIYFCFSFLVMFVVLLVFTASVVRFIESRG
jgi:hypothetical protein